MVMREARMGVGLTCGFDIVVEDAGKAETEGFESGSYSWIYGIL